MDSQRQYKPSTHEDRSSLIDWGEAIDAPALWPRRRAGDAWAVGAGRGAPRRRPGGPRRHRQDLPGPDIARQVLPHFEGRAVSLPLRNAPPPADVFDELIRAASARQSDAARRYPRQDRRTRRDHLRTRRCLLILDNLDTIIQAGRALATTRPSMPPMAR